MGGEDFTKYMMLCERYNPPVGQVWSKSRSLAPLHRKTETTTAVPNVTSNCWLTPAEASRLKPKRRLSDGLLLTHIPTSTSVELPESANRSSTGTSTPGSKFSIVSAKNTKESSRDSSDFNTAPPQRQWRKLDELSKDGFPFTLMCYNLLSPNYATPNQYPYCPSWALNWDYRRRSILDEIRIYHANIICLQEVETNQFEEIFKPELEKLKYDAVFLPKSRRRTMDTKDGKKVDGCAIFWQTDKFEKLHEFHHEFMISCSNVCEKPTPLILDRVMTRDNVALGVIFETKGSTGADGTGGRQFCVTTGHIHWDPEHSDVKMIQTILWTAELWAYIDQFLTGSVESLDRSSPTNSRSTPLSTRLPVPGPSSPAANMPVILCGDLNSLPESGVVEFLMRGSLPKTHNDFLNNGFKYMFEDWRLLEKWAVDGDTLRHRFAFDRAYRESQGMKLTNFTYEFKGMIDYVLYTRQHFRLLGSLDQIHESWFAERKIVGCPHVHFPSDHFALLVELELKPTPQVSGLVAARRSARNRSHSETASDPGQSKPNASVGSSPSSLAGGSTPYNRTRAESGKLKLVVQRGLLLE
ncbi:endonuclease/exonuclease/phosphatase family protein, partial [Opisthorchis viverrini]